MRNETITVLLRAFLTDLLFPRRCPVCGDIVLPRGELICPACVKKLSFVKQPVCKKCGKEISSAEREYCLDCTKHKRSFDYGRALLNYNDTAKNPWQISSTETGGNILISMRRRSVCGMGLLCCGWEPTLWCRFLSIRRGGVRGDSTRLRFLPAGLEPDWEFRCVQSCWCAVRRLRRRNS